MKLLEDSITQKRRQICETLGIPIEMIKEPLRPLPPLPDPFKRYRETLEKYVKNILEAQKITGESKLVFK